jgi:hypothetical protein
MAIGLRPSNCHRIWEISISVIKDNWRGIAQLVISRGPGLLQQSLPHFGGHIAIGVAIPTLFQGERHDRRLSGGTTSDRRTSVEAWLERHLQITLRVGFLSAAWEYNIH